MAEFDIECFQNEFLPAGGTLMNAVITVTAEGRPPPDRRRLVQVPASAPRYSSWTPRAP